MLKKLCFALALLLLTNRVRPEAAQTFRYFAQQGVAIKVISGDNPMTVSEVARRAGIAGYQCPVDGKLFTAKPDKAQQCYRKADVGFRLCFF